MSDYPVVVGVTGSPGSAAVVGWAAREAAARGRGLRLVHAAAYDSGEVPAWRRHARAVLARAAGIARAAAPGVAVEVALHHEHPVQTLVAAAAEADLLVLGAIGHERPGDGPADPILLGVLHTVRVPVAVIHPDTAGRSGPVVVGIKHPVRDAALVRMAYDCAHQRGSGLRLVHACRPASGHTDAAAQVADLARAWGSDQVVVHSEVVDERVLPALLRAARHAGLLVLGTHRPDRRAWIRSTTTELARGADCPVLIVPPTPADTPTRRRELHRAAGHAH